MTDAIVNESAAEERLRAARMEKLAKLKALGVNPYPYSFQVSHRAAELHQKYEGLALETVTEDVVTVAGRVRAYRNNGMFIDLHDATGKVQIFSQEEALEPVLECLDIGDMIGVSGVIRRTKRGELTVNATSITVLAKTLATLPDKFHGLQDVEARYRQRYVDLIMNEDSRARFRTRSHIIQRIREVLQARGFMEVETPMLQVIPGGAAAKPFVTHHNTLDLDMYLRIAPELYLKRLIVGGLSERVFELNRNFRNEGMSPKHNPEFTMLEAYQAFTDYEGMMELAEALISEACIAANGTPEVKFVEKGKETLLSFKPPFKRATMCGFVKEVTGVDFLALDEVGARAALKQLRLECSGKENWGQCVERAFGERVEPTITQPVHVHDYPREISPFAKAHRTDARLTERFETFCMGREVANAFSELSDPQDQLARFTDQLKQREQGNDEAERIDMDYVAALEHGLPPTGGIGIGIDRLVMLLTGTETIRDVILFPTLKPRD
jgi:lysyl-tRNA synthetase class 2